MAYKVIILYRLYMPSYFLGTFTEYPQLKKCLVKSGKDMVFLFVERMKYIFDGARRYLLCRMQYIFVGR